MRRNEILDECQREDIDEEGGGESLLRIKDGEGLKKESIGLQLSQEDRIEMEVRQRGNEEIG